MTNLTRTSPGLSRDLLGALVLAYAESGDLAHAARRVGLPLADAVAALRTHGARQMMARAMRHVLDLQAAPEALAVARASLRDDSARVRMDAAKTILDRAGLVARPEQAAAERGLSELSADDLRALIGQLQAEEAERAAAPPVAEPEDVDYLD